MTKFNPLIEAMGSIDDVMVEKAQSPAKKPRRIRTAVIAAVAAALLLGTTAVAATFGDNPIVKINNKQVTSRYSSYVDDNGWTIETTAVELPVDYCRYKPVGEIRAVFDKDADAPFTYQYYDELGVRLGDVPNWVELYVIAKKDGEMTHHGMSEHGIDDHHQSTTISPDGKLIEIEFWQDPVQALKSEIADKRFKKMSAEERYKEIQIYGDPFEYAELDGFKNPTYLELCAIEDIRYTQRAATFTSLPSEAMKLYDYAPVVPAGFSEKAGLSAFLFTDATRSEDGWMLEVHEVTQEMFVYTLIEEQSGTEVLFTVWRSAENKDTYTDHFDFEYEYIPLNNGTEARLHQSAYGFYILEFEKDGAAYGLQLGGERDLAQFILEKMELL